MAIASGMLAILVSICCIAGCGREEQAVVPRAGDNIDELEDIPIGRPDPTLTIGAGGDGDSVYFGLPVDVALDEANRIYVLDAYAFQVQVFSPGGKLLRQFGTQGNGPGEFTNARAIAIVDSIVFIADDVIERFTTEGSGLPGIRPPDRGLISRVERLFGSEESLLVLITAFDQERHQTRIDTMVVKRIDPTTGADADALRIPYSTYQQGEGRTGPAAMGARPSITGFGRGLLAATVGDSFHLRVTNRSGSVTRDVVLTVPRIENTAQDYDTWRSNLPRKPARGLPRATLRPVVGGLVGSRGGMLLVRRFDVTPYTDPNPAAESEWVLLGVRGNPIRRYRFSRRFSPRALSDCWIIGLSKQGDTPVIVQYPTRPQDQRAGDGPLPPASCY